MAVVNCAAYTNVDGAESHREAAFAVNADGAHEVARACADAGVRLIHISTDYVFSGDARQPYVEDDAPAPRTVYGQSKLEGERRVVAALPEAAIVRTSWLFGAGHRNFCETMLSLGAVRERVEVVDDQCGSPTWTGELAAALDLLLDDPAASGVFHLAGAGACSWADLAEELFLRAGVDCDVDRVPTHRVPRPAPRPAWSALKSTRPDAPTMAPWPEHVAHFLADRGARHATGAR
jgi:dTDP-4-dehydrorhamnose reductase